MPQEGRRYEFCPDLLVFFRAQVCCLWAWEDPSPVTTETRIYEVPCSKQFRIWWRKMWMKVEYFHSGIGLGLTCASCIQDPIDSNLSIAISRHLLWPAEPGHHRVSYCRKAVELLRSLQIWYLATQPALFLWWVGVVDIWFEKSEPQNREGRFKRYIFCLQSETPVRISAKIKINLWLVSFLSRTNWTLQ